MSARLLQRIGCFLSNADFDVTAHLLQKVLVVSRGVVAIVRVVVCQPAVVAVQPSQDLRPLAERGPRGAVDPVLVAHDHREPLPRVGQLEPRSCRVERLAQRKVGVESLGERRRVEFDGRAGIGGIERRSAMQDMSVQPHQTRLWM